MGSKESRDRGALVLGTDYRGLGIVRSLGRRGIPVWTVHGEDDGVAARSRYTRRSLDWPGDDDGRVAFLLDLAQRHGLAGWVLFPTGDEVAAFLARRLEALAATFIVAAPPWEQQRWAYDKRLTYALAERVGVGIPRTSFPASRRDVERFGGAFPVVLKPTSKPRLNRLTLQKAWPAPDGATLLRCYDEAVALVDPALLAIQEIVPGAGETQLSFAALCRCGVPLVWLVARRARQWPPDFGRSSSYVYTVEDAEVERKARTMLAAMELTGLVEVEFKRDPRDGRLLLLDVNARVWGWHTIACRHGVDFPYLYWRLLLGQDVPVVRAPPGLRWLRGTTDAAAAFEEIRARQLSLGSYLRSVAGRHERAVFARDDPLPGLLELPLFAQMAVRRLASSGAV
jgi:D-aspartate ligase